NDIAIVIDTEDESKVDEVNEAVDTELAGGGGSDESAKSSEAHNWKRALELANNPNLAMISIPCTYAPMESENALHNGLHVFMFSDNVATEHEVHMIELTYDKG